MSVVRLRYAERRWRKGRALPLCPLFTSRWHGHTPSSPAPAVHLRGGGLVVLLFLTEEVRRGEGWRQEARGGGSGRGNSMCEGPGV